MIFNETFPSFSSTFWGDTQIQREVKLIKVSFPACEHSDEAKMPLRGNFFLNVKYLGSLWVHFDAISCELCSRCIFQLLSSLIIIFIYSLVRLSPECSLIATNTIINLNKLHCMRVNCGPQTAALEILWMTFSVMQLILCKIWILPHNHWSRLLIIQKTVPSDSKLVIFRWLQRSALRVDEKMNFSTWIAIN